MVNNTEFTEEPICTASSKYQKLKINQLKSLSLPVEQYEYELQKVLDKECLCIGLSNSASIRYKQPFLKSLPKLLFARDPTLLIFQKQCHSGK